MCSFNSDESGSLTDLLANSPSNWKKWGEDDEIGALNYLTPDIIYSSVQTIQTGKTFTLGLKVKSDSPNLPGRFPTAHFMSQDKGAYETNKVDTLEGGNQFADDVVLMDCHGPTHCDALGHTWYDNQAWNGFDASETKSGMGRASITPIAEKGIVGRAVLLDVASYKGVKYLSMNYQVTLEDILKTVEYQNSEIHKGDIILLRTGIFNLYFEKGAETFYSDFNEPGITYEPDLVNWFYENEISVFGSDTIMNEQMKSSTVNAVAPMHAALSRNLGVVFNENLWLDQWAEDCISDGKYDGLYVTAPLKVEYGSAGPVNPVVIK